MFVDDFFLGQELEFTKSLQELAVKVHVSAFLVCTSQHGQQTTPAACLVSSGSVTIVSYHAPSTMPQHVMAHYASPAVPMLLMLMLLTMLLSCAHKSWPSATEQQHHLPRLGIRKSIRPVNIEPRGVTGMVICLQRGVNNLHMVQLMPVPPHHLLLH